MPNIPSSDDCCLRHCQPGPESKVAGESYRRGGADACDIKFNGPLAVNFYGTEGAIHRFYKIIT
jgi:hypothetical protein